MEMTIDFPGGDRVDAHFGAYTVMTDQPRVKGEPGSAPMLGYTSWAFASNATCPRKVCVSSNAYTVIRKLA
jgi:hypothetical protein